MSLLLANRSLFNLNILSDGNTVAFYDSQNLNTVTKDGSDFVSRWNDVLGSGIDLIQATGTNQPVWSEDGILFDGIDNFLRTPLFVYNQPCSIYIIFKQITWTSQRRILVGTGAFPLIWQFGGISPAIEMNNPGPINSGMTLNTFGILRAFFNSTSSKLQVNEITPIIGDGGTTGFAQGVAIGALTTGASASNIQVKGVLLRKIADTSADEQAIYDFLKNKYIKYTNILVYADGTGDYTSIKTAIAAITDATYLNRYNLIIKGTFNEMYIISKNYVNLVGVSKEEAIINGSLPNDTAEATIIAQSTIHASNRDFDIMNLTITGTNCRYVIHDDGVTDGGRRIISNCIIEHLGNDGADLYWGHEVWEIMAGIGHGFNGNQHLTIIDCVVKGRYTGLYTHTSTIERAMSKMIVKRSTFNFTGTNYPFSIRFGQLYNNGDLYNFEDCILTGIDCYGADFTGLVSFNRCTKTYIQTFLTGPYIYEIDIMENYQNNSLETIDRGMGVKMDGFGGIEKITNSDLLSDLVGVVLEEILPGGFGNIKTDGYFQAKFLALSPVTPVTIGDVFGVSAIAGKFGESISPYMLECDVDDFLKII